VVVTRPALQIEPLANALSDRGAIPIWRPLVEFSDPDNFGPLDAAISKLANFDWLIFTSAEAVRAVARRSCKLGRSLKQGGNDLRVAAVGPATAQAIQKAGMQVSYEAQTHSGVRLASELGERVRGKKVLLPRSDRAKPDLPLALKNHGAEVTEVIAYRTLLPTAIQREELNEFASGKADAILFFSPSAVTHFAEAFGQKQLHNVENKLAIAAVGPVTAKALQEAGVKRVVIASDTTAMAVIEALEKHFAGMMNHAQAGTKLR
jgi:uroporphyrinogen III methyltransferase/synthase